MGKMTLKERIFYGFVCSESRVYRHWYTRFLLGGMDLERTRRVVGRIRKWHNWCYEWFEEGCRMEQMAEEALADGNNECAKRWFHESAVCFHVGQHFFYFDDALKAQSLEKIWSLYPKVLALYPENHRPIRVDIPFRGVQIPGYLRLQPTPGEPLVVQINGLDNLKEIEQHTIGQILFQAGFNAITFDGPGQGEMWKSMKMIPDYHAAVSAVIDWLKEKYDKHIDMDRIGVIGFSMGGFFAPQAAAHDKRIKCAAGNGGPADLDFMLPERKANPIILRGFPHAAGTDTLSEAVETLKYNISKEPPLERPMLIHHSGRDKIIPNGKKHADKFLDWAVGEKELKFYPDGEHVCANYLDEVLPYATDWLKKHFTR
ncbi:alpha/beta hydrolase family protein [Thermodesulfobacteriota bacterium]